MFRSYELLTKITDVFKDQRVTASPYDLVMPTVNSSNLKTHRDRAPAEVLVLSGSGLELFLPHPYLFILVDF